MNIIEQLGGYELTKQVFDSVPKDGNSYTVTRDDTGASFHSGEIFKALLDYRRQHNIFEVGDKVVVLTNALGNKYTWIVKSIDGIMVEVSQLGQLNEWVHYSEIAHTTPEEIKAGKRLEVKSDS